MAHQDCSPEAVSPLHAQLQELREGPDVPLCTGGSERGTPPAGVITLSFCPVLVLLLGSVDTQQDARCRLPFLEEPPALQEITLNLLSPLLGGGPIEQPPFPPGPPQTLAVPKGDLLRNPLPPFV